MNFDGGAVQAHLLYPDRQDLLRLQAGEDTVQNPRFAPAVHPGVNGGPVAKPGRQTPPFASIFHHVKEGVKQGQIIQADIATLAWQAVGNPLILVFSEFPVLKIPPDHLPSISVSTQSSV